MVVSSFGFNRMTFVHFSLFPVFFFFFLLYNHHATLEFTAAHVVGGASLFFSVSFKRMVSNVEED
jgi:hypothetical protein